MKKLMSVLGVSAALLTGCPDEPPANRAPSARDVSLKISDSIPYVEQNLNASDPDGDAITYELTSAVSGTGYKQAIVVPKTGRLYVTIAPGYLGTLSLTYRATDGKMYSGTARVSIQVSTESVTDRETGSETVDAREYATFQEEYFETVLQASASGASAAPNAIDLSGNFPIPGNQGQQGSCVGWATAYALKSYQERLEMGWTLNAQSRVFSPAYVFNQIAASGCQGSQIYDALNLIVDQGCATLASTPYTDSTCGTQPSSSARSEASKFPGARWYRVGSVQEVKDALANRLPVVIGMDVYQNFMYLSGSGSVYNTIGGSYQGGHAVTITGFDDSRYGGAFRVINSWGTGWGDQGYFWMPYSFATQVVRQLYVLIDAKNGSVSPNGPTDPVDNGLPNLQVVDWSANYNTQPGGAGTLKYRITNTGTRTAPSGVNVGFMLSRDQSIGRDDIYIFWEDVPFSFEPGNVVYRDDTNAIRFNFPQSIASGTYYMALWLDDLNEVRESNEGDNIAPGTNTLVFQNGRPDLVVDTWYANWDGAGNGRLQYRVRNQGNSAVTDKRWDINLVLSPDYRLGDGNDYFIFHEEAGITPAPGVTVVRDTSNPGYFNLTRQWNGNGVAAGTYYMAFWVDYFALVNESNENNNVSWGQNLVTLNKSVGNGKSGDGVEAGEEHNGILPAPNGMLVKKVSIEKDAAGAITLRVMEEGVNVKDSAESLDFHESVNASADAVIFPVSQEIAMP